MVLKVYAVSATQQEKKNTGNSILVRYLTHTEVNGQCNNGTHREIPEIMQCVFVGSCKIKQKGKMTF